MCIMTHICLTLCNLIFPDKNDHSKSKLNDIVFNSLQKIVDTGLYMKHLID